MRALKLFTRLFDVRAHGLKALLRVGFDQFKRLKISIGQPLRSLWVVGQKLRRATKGIHHHRIVEGGRNDAACLGFGPNGGEIGLIGHPGVQIRGASDHGIRCRLGLKTHDVHVFERQAVLLEHPGEREIRRSPWRAGSNRLALEVGDLLNARLYDHAVGPKAFIQLKNLGRCNAIRVPDHPCFHCGRRTLHIARSDRQVSIFLGDFFNGDVESLFLEEPRFFGQRKWRETSPTRYRDRDLGLLCLCLSHV